MSSKVMAQGCPTEWSDEVSALYNPIRPLGKGGFGSVWLAKAKTKTKAQDEKVAIKVVGHPYTHNKKTSYAIQRIEEGTFHREIAVLTEMNHPHIVRFLKFFQVSPNENESSPTTTGAKTNQHCAPYCMVLSYHKGPTLQMLIEHGGALGLPLSKVVSRQLIDAVSYLHDHSVIHRDIKPDNIIVGGASLQMDECWSNTLETADEIEKMSKWSITLIDFGFARKLPLPRDEAVEGRGRSKVRRIEALDQSISHVKFRRLSAVGNRNYAAPEIFKTIRRYPSNETMTNKSSKKQGDSDVPPLAEYVSDYGMVADAFSVGMTLRYMLTGVPPSEASIDEFIAMQNHPLLSLSRNLKKLNKKKSKGLRKKQYRTSEELSGEVRSVIAGLTRRKEEDRATVRSTKGHSWLNS